MPKRKPVSDNYFRITGIGSATKQPDGKWLTDARRKGIPKKHQRKVFPTKKDAKAHLETLKKNLKRYGQLKATNQDFFSDDELTQARILLEELNEQHGLRYALNDVVDIGVRAETARIKSLSFPLLKDVVTEYLDFRSTPQGKQRGGGTIDKHQLGQEKLFFKSVCSWFGEKRLDKIFAPDTKFKKLATDKLRNNLKQLGPDHLDVARRYKNIEEVYKENGEYDKSLEYEKKFLAIALKQLGPEDHYVASTYFSIGSKHYTMGEYDQALECTQKSLAIQLKILGPDDLDAASSYCALGYIHHKMGHPAQVKEYWEKALAIYESRGDEANAQKLREQIANLESKPATE